MCFFRVFEIIIFFNKFKHLYASNGFVSKHFFLLLSLNELLCYLNFAFSVKIIANEIAGIETSCCGHESIDDNKSLSDSWATIFIMQI